MTEARCRIIRAQQEIIGSRTLNPGSETVRFKQIINKWDVSFTHEPQDGNVEGNVIVTFHFNDDVKVPVPPGKIRIFGYNETQIHVEHDPLVTPIT